jgi:hypothetical protein
MLMTGNYRCILADRMIAIKEQPRRGVVARGDHRARHADPAPALFKV